MAAPAFTKPVNKIVVIDSKKTGQFLAEFNKNKVTEEFIQSCKKAEKLFRKGK